MIKPKKKTNRKELTVYIFLAFYIFSLMFFCAGSSPFINYMSIDSSVFFVMGRGMAHGRIVYAELFDHKGWYIYFINCLGALISDSTTIGIFLIESCFIYLDAILYYNIAKTYIKTRYKCLIMSLVMILVTLNYCTYQVGNLTEIYVLSFQLLSFLLIVKYFESGKIAHSPIIMLLHGINVGIVFELRANMIIMWGAIAIIIIARLLYYHEFINTIHNIIFGIIGIMIGLLPPAIYGITTNSLEDMFEQTILFNMAYSGNNNLLSNIVGTFGNWLGIIVLSICFLSSIIVLLNQEISKWIKYMYMLALILSIFGISLSARRYGHYFEYFIPLYIPLFIFLINLFESHLFKRKVMRTIIIAVLFCTSICFNLCTPIKLCAKPASWYYKPSAAILADKYKRLNMNDGKVLVTGNNALLYNKMDVIPSIKYFYIPSISYNKFPYAIDSQMSSILNKENDVIVICYSNHQNYINKIIYNESVQNEEVYDFLTKEYKKIYDNNDEQMWVKKIQ